MNSLLSLSVTLAGVCTLFGCSSDAGPIECKRAADCNLFYGGQCLDLDGASWCAYPDQSCPSEMRWSDRFTDEAIAGDCVDPTLPDAGDNPDGADGARTDAGNDAAQACRHRLLFHSKRDNTDDELYVMEPDGTGQVNLTNAVGRHDIEGSWSPDGTQIAFTADFAIWSMAADGTGAHALTSGAFDVNPQWSPDGEQITFLRISGNETDIWVIDADGSDAVNLTPTLAGAAGPQTWSPDGSTIAFVQFEPNVSAGEIYVMNASGANKRNLSQNSAAEDGTGNDPPMWSPDGTRIAFLSKRQSTVRNVWVMDSNGADQHNIANSVTNESEPIWSPDGSKIVFLRGTSLNADVWIMNPDGSAQQNLSNDGTEDKDLAVAPDGTIAWASYRDSNFEIYTMALDGEHQVRLTTNGGEITDDRPSWRSCVLAK